MPTKREKIKEYNISVQDKIIFSDLNIQHLKKNELKFEN